MNRSSAALLLLASVTVSGCATEAPPTANADTDSARIACRDPRPMVCTMVYDPVCAEMNDGSEREYASQCNACADVAVAAYRPGACGTN